MVKRTFIAAVLLSALVAACAPSVEIRPVTAGALELDRTYDAYLYAGGLRQGLRSALLVEPGSPVEVVSRTPGVVRARVNAGDAVAFVGKGRKGVEIKRVSYRGETAGYLVSQRRPYLVGRYVLDEYVFVRGGKLHFSVIEPAVDY